MGQIVPDPIERYLSVLNRAGDELLDEIARKGADAGLPLIDKEVGTLLQLLATAIGARRILEIGTAIGYSGIWLAKALPDDGMLITMEMNEDRARTARSNFATAGVAERVSIVGGDAQRMMAKVAGPFDLIFQDGDKRLYVPLLEPLVARLRPGGLLVTDNVLWDGEVVPGYVSHPKRNPDETRAIAQYNDHLNSHPELLTATVPLRDGLSISLKRR